MLQWAVRYVFLAYYTWVFYPVSVFIHTWFFCFFCNDSNCWNLNVTLKGILNEQPSMCSRSWSVPNIFTSQSGWMDGVETDVLCLACLRTHTPCTQMCAGRFMLYLSFHRTHMHTPVEAFFQWVWLTAVMEAKISLINWEDGWEWDATQRLTCSISAMPLWHHVPLLQRFVNTAEQHLFDCTHGLHFAKWYFVIAEKWASWINFDTQLFAIPSVTLKMSIVVQNIR